MAEQPHIKNAAFKGAVSGAMLATVYAVKDGVNLNMLKGPGIQFVASSLTDYVNNTQNMYSDNKSVNFTLEALSTGVLYGVASKFVLGKSFLPSFILSTVVDMGAEGVSRQM